MSNMGGPERERVDSLKCPRCGNPSLSPLVVMNSVSRVDGETMICNACGTGESLDDYMNPGQPMTKDRWAVQGERE